MASHRTSNAVELYLSGTFVSFETAIPRLCRDTGTQEDGNEGSTK